MIPALITTNLLCLKNNWLYKKHRRLNFSHSKFYSSIININSIVSYSWKSKIYWSNL